MIKEAMLIIYASPNGRDNWRQLKPQEVPAWVKEPSVMGQLVAGEMAMKADDGLAGSLWYRAQRVVSVDEANRIHAAQRKRGARNSKRVAH